VLVEIYRQGKTELIGEKRIPVGV